MSSPPPSPSPSPPPVAPTWTWDPEAFTAEPGLFADYRRRWPQHFVWAAENEPSRWSLQFLHDRTGQHPGRSAVAVEFGPLATNSFGQVQGGALASVFDVAMLLGASQLGDGVGATTAYLNIRFRRPVQLLKPCVVLSECRREGRKLFVLSRLMYSGAACDAAVGEGDGRKEMSAAVLAEADALFVIPRPDSKVQRIGQQPQPQQQPRPKQPEKGSEGSPPKDSLL